MPTNSIEYKDEGIYYNGKPVPNISSQTEKTSLDDNDVILLEDSLDSNNKKKITKSNFSSSLVAGTDGQVQFNDSGSFGASSGLVWDKTNGRLGVGTNTPSYPLEVNGETKIGTTLFDESDGYTRLKLNKVATGDRNSLLSFYATDDLTVTGDTDNISAGIYRMSGIDGNLDFRNRGAGKFNWLTQDTPLTIESIKMTLDNDGNLGIGEEFPSAKVDIKGGDNDSLLSAFGTSGGGLSIGTDASADGYMSMWDSTSAMKIHLRTDGFASFIAGGGKLGIGTNSPNTKFDVVGSNVTAHNPNDLAWDFNVLDEVATIRTGNSFYGAETGLNFGTSGAEARTLASIWAKSWGAGYGNGRLAFRTSNTDVQQTRMVIDEVGNVGIGVDSPMNGRLEIDGDIAVMGYNKLKIRSGNSWLFAGGAYSGSYDYCSLAGNFERIDDTTGNIPHSSLGTSEIILLPTNGGAGTIRFSTGNVDTVPTEKVRITGEGKVGVRTSNPLAFLDVSSPSVDTPGSDYSALKFSSSGNTHLFAWRVGASNKDLNLDAFDYGSVWNTVLTVDRQARTIQMPFVYSQIVGATNRDLFIDSTGKLGYVASSERYKENIQDLGDVNWIHNLRPVTFDYINKEQGVEKTGLIAEEVEKVNPKLVSYNETNQPETVLYSELVTPLLKQVQEQQKVIEKQDSLINDLLNRVQQLEQK